MLQLEKEGEHQQEENEAMPKGMTFEVGAHQGGEEWVTMEMVEVHQAAMERVEADWALGPSLLLDD